MTEKKVYTIDELVQMLQVTRRTIYNYIKEGKIKAVKIGKYWRVTDKALEEFLTPASDR